MRAIACFSQSLQRAGTWGAMFGIIGLLWAGSANAVERRLHIDFDKVTCEDAERLCGITCNEGQEVLVIGQIVETGDCVEAGLAGGNGIPGAENTPFSNGVAAFAINTKLKDVTGKERKIEGVVAATTDRISFSPQPSFDQTFLLWLPLLNVIDPNLPDLTYLNPWKDADVEVLEVEYEQHRARILAETGEDIGAFRSNEQLTPPHPQTGEQYPMGFSQTADNPSGLPDWFVFQQTSTFRADIRPSIQAANGTDPNTGQTTYDTIVTSGYFAGKKGYIICRCFYDNFSVPKYGFGLFGCNHCQFLIVWEDDDATPLKGSPNV